MTLARGYEQAGADAIELNLICLNITFSERRIRDTMSHGAVIGQHPEIIETVVRAVRDAVKIPVFAKLTPNVNDITVTAKAAVRGGASGIVMAGGQSALPRVDIHGGGRPLGAYCCDGYSFGSMGGPGIIHQSFALTAQLARAVDVPITAGGGLSTWEDGIMFMMWGALVTACTVMWEGFGAAKTIVDAWSGSWRRRATLLGRHPRSAPLPEARPRAEVVRHGGHRRAKCIACLKCWPALRRHHRGRRHARFCLKSAPAEYAWECARLRR